MTNSLLNKSGVPFEFTKHGEEKYWDIPIDKLIPELLYYSVRLPARIAFIAKSNLGDEYKTEFIEIVDTLRMKKAI